MRSKWVILVALSVWAGPAWGQLTATLEVSGKQDPAFSPYRAAKLTLTNSAAAAVETVTLRAAAGGPTVRYDLTVAPGADGELVVHLPAMSPVQQYTVTALDAGGAQLGRAVAPIAWPAELVSANAFIDNSFSPWMGDRADWPLAYRGHLLALLGMFTAGAAAALLIGNRWARPIAVILAAGTAVGLATYIFIPAQAPICQQTDYVLDMIDDDGVAWRDSFSVYTTTRRAEVIQQDGSSLGMVHPVYADAGEARADDTLVVSATRSVYVTVRPGRPRVVRRLHCTQTGGSSGRRGTVRRESAGFTVRDAGASTEGVFIFNDLIWRGSWGQSDTIFLPDDEAQLYWVFLSGLSDQEIGFDRRRLLEYWRRNRQQMGEMYLVEIPDLGRERPSFTVIQLRRQPTSTTTSAPVK